MIDQLLTNPALSVLERTLNFTEQRHQVILENIANASTPGYVQKDVSVAEFQKSLQNALARQQEGFNAPLQPRSTASVSFDADSNAVAVHPQPVTDAMPFHDRGVRSMESLMTQLADNAQVHNMAAQLLKGRYGWLQTAIQLRV